MGIADQDLVQYSRLPPLCKWMSLVRAGLPILPLCSTAPMPQTTAGFADALTVGADLHQTTKLRELFAGLVRATAPPKQ